MTAPPTAPLALVVDDDLDIRVGRRGMRVTDGEAVVDLAVEHEPTHTVATRLRANRRPATIPVVFLTGETASPYRSVSLMLGGLAHLHKPFTREALRAVVEEALST